MSASIRRSNASSSSAAAATLAAASAASGFNSVSIATILKDLPVLRLRKDIWENFPVCLEKLDAAADGRDRYYVRWHRKNLATWSQGIPQYPAIAKLRLIRALKANTNDWITCNAPAEEDAICILEMALPGERIVALPANYATALDPKAAPPTIESLDDIRTNYPICWTMQTDGSAVLSYHDRQLRKLAQILDHPVDEIRGLVHEKLVAGLWNGGWIIDASAATNDSIGVVCKAVRSRLTF